MKENQLGRKGNNEEEKKGLSRRNFLKFGAVAGAVGASYLASKKLDEVMTESFKEDERHEKSGQAIVFKKEHTDPNNQLLMISPKGVPTIIPHAENWAIIFKIGETETHIDVSKQVYEKHKVGDSIPVKYDDRTEKVKEILDENKK